MLMQWFLATSTPHSNHDIKIGQIHVMYGEKVYAFKHIRNIEQQQRLNHQNWDLNPPL